MKVLVTGASGFIGSHLLPVLTMRGHEVVAASRTPIDSPGANWRLAPQLGSGADWSRVLQGVDAVVHLAGYSHIGGEGENEEILCRRINAEGTGKLVRQAGECGVQHFLFLSSCHAVAAESDELITAEIPPRPTSAYGRSKLAAEKAVREELEGTACRWTMLRPPLVYGADSNGNFSSLLKLVKAGVPLPLASVHNRRSFLYVENLIDVIAVCLGNPKAYGKVFLPSDGKDVSTPELIRAIASANAAVEEDGRGKIGDGLETRYSSPATRYSPRLFPFPESLLKALGRLPGLRALQKLTSSLYVDGEPIRRELGWTPPFTMEDGVRQTLAKLP